MSTNVSFKEKLNTASKHVAAGNLLQALELYSELTVQYPELGELHTISGKVAFELNEFALTIEIMSRALRIDPNDQIALFFLGKSLLATDKIQAAESCFLKITKLNPKFLSASCELGSIYLKQGKIEQSFKILRKVVETDFTFDKAYYHLVHLFRKQNMSMLAQVYLVLYQHHSNVVIEDDGKGNSFPDSFFIDRNKAMITAKQGNIIKQTVAVSARQLCYYQGKPFANPPETLIHIPEDGLLDLFTKTCLRLPQAINFNPADPSESSLASNMANKFEDLKRSLGKEYDKWIEISSDSKPEFNPGEPFRIFLAASRMTTVMQYASRGIAEALRRNGCDVLLSIENSDLEQQASHHVFNKCANFIPHAIININHLANNYISDNTYNISWWQDLMPAIEVREPLPWRERDIAISTYPQFDPYLYKTGAKHVYRQEFCVDTQQFFATTPTEQRNKIVFVGNSYINHVTSRNEILGLEIANILRERMASGEEMSDTFLQELAKRFSIAFINIYENVLPYVVRDTSIEWLCSMADELDYEVEIYGRFWDKNPIVAPYFKGELAHGKEVAKVYNQAKYAIAAIHRHVHSQRLAELTACGCIPVVFDQRMFPEAEPPHWDDECLFYSTRDELRECFFKIPKNDPKIIGETYSYDNFAKKIITLLKTGSYPTKPVAKTDIDKKLQ